MKIKVILLAFLIFGLACKPSAAQAELVYHFLGQLTQIETDDAGLIAAKGLDIGSPLEYTFVVDFARQAEITHYDGSIEIIPDLPRPGEQGNITVDSFFADFLGGNFLSDPVASQMTWPNGTLKNVGGSYTIDPNFASGGLMVFGSYYYFSLFQYNHPQFWKVGDQINVISVANNLDGLPSIFRGIVSLDKVSEVPLPSAFWLMASWVSIFIGRERLFRRQSLA